jgi:hypothetical protein
MKKKLVFIVGAGRSGTTVFSKFLSMHSNCFALSEPHFFDAQIRADDVCSCERKYSQCDFWQSVIQRLNEKGFSMDTFSTSAVPFFDSSSMGQKIIRNINLFLHFKLRLPYVFKAYYRQIANEAVLLDTIAGLVKEQYIIDASKSFVRALFLHQYLEKKYDIFYIILGRDPRGNVCSQLKTSSKIEFADETVIVKEKERKTRFQDAIQHWTSVMRKYLLFDRLFGTHAQKIVYEDFVNDPKTTFIQKVSSHLGISWEEGMADLTTKEHHLLGGNYSRINARSIHPAREEWRNLPADQIEYIHHKTKNILKQFAH